MGHIKHCFNCKLRWVVLCCMIFSKGRVVWYCHKFSNFHAQVLKSFPSSSTFIGVKKCFLSLSHTNKLDWDESKSSLSQCNPSNYTSCTCIMPPKLFLTLNRWPQNIVKIDIKTVKEKITVHANCCTSPKTFDYEKPSTEKILVVLIKPFRVLLLNLWAS